MKKLIIMSGPAGSGKSTWAENYADENENTVVLSTDFLRQSLFHTQYPDGKSEKVIKQTIVDKAIEASESGLNVIVDSAVVKNRSIMRWWHKLHKYFDESELVIINTSFEQCLKQNQMRERHVPEYVIRDMFTFKEPLNKEILDSFTDVTIIDNCNKEEK